MNNADVGRTIRLARKHRKMTIQELADLTNFSRASVNNIELGRQTITVDRLVELMDALGFEVTLRIKPKKTKA